MRDASARRRNRLNSMKVVLGVGGGIAAYKAAELATRAPGARLHGRSRHDIRRARVHPAPHLRLAHRPKSHHRLVRRTSGEETLSSAVEHIRVAQDNDTLVVAPPPPIFWANSPTVWRTTFFHALSRFHGQSRPRARHEYQHVEPSGRCRIIWKLCVAVGMIVEPDEGLLACGDYGPGRLAEPDYIAQVVVSSLKVRRDLEGETVIVTAGPTQEPLDPVRYISNRSSGKMGYAIAEAAAARGAKVILISGPVKLPVPAGSNMVRVRTACEMRAAVMENLPHRHDSKGRRRGRLSRRQRSPTRNSRRQPRGFRWNSTPRRTFWRRWARRRISC